MKFIKPPPEIECKCFKTILYTFLSHVLSKCVFVLFLNHIFYLLKCNFFPGSIPEQIVCEASVQWRHQLWSWVFTASFKFCKHTRPFNSVVPSRFGVSCLTMEGSLLETVRQNIWNEKPRLSFKRYAVDNVSETRTEKLSPLESLPPPPPSLSTN